MDFYIQTILSILPIFAFVLSLINSIVIFFEKRRNDEIAKIHDKELLKIKEQLTRYNSFVDEIYKKHLEPMLEIIKRASFFNVKNDREKFDYIDEFYIEYNNLKKFLKSNLSNLKYNEETDKKINEVILRIDELYEELSNTNCQDYKNIMSKSAYASNAIDELINLD